MSVFSPDWLALREPHDLAARDQGVEDLFLASLPRGGARLLDLASGTGSTVAALNARLGKGTRWLLTDHDPALLEVAAERWGAEVATRRIDLAADLEDLPCAEVDGITTSAFLDLVSEDFLARLVEQVVAAGKPFLASLSYDGRAEFEPPHPADVAVTGGLNAHQLGDKGFGPALGPGATARAAELFEARGYKVVLARSDWQVGSDAPEFLHELLGGFAGAARETGLGEDHTSAWLGARAADLAAGRLRGLIGHLDLVAVPTD